MNNKLNPPYRVGRKNGKAVLDKDGQLVLYAEFKNIAELFCNFLNELPNQENLISDEEIQKLANKNISEDYHFKGVNISPILKDVYIKACEDYRVALQSAPINEVKEDKVVWRNASELTEIDYPLCIKLDGGGAPYYETIYSMDNLKKNVTDWCPIDKIMYLNEDNVEFKIKDAEKELKEKIKNLPQTYGEKGLGKVYDIAINDVLNLLK